MDRHGLNFWTEKDKRLEAAHLLDLVEDTLEQGGRLVTPFLSPSLSTWLDHQLKGADLQWIFWGGWKGAERVRAVLDGDHGTPTNADAQVAVLQVVPQQKNAELGHRHLLGSLLGLGLERGLVGDILMAEKGPIVLVGEQIEEYILQNWEQVGREKIKVIKAPGSVPEQAQEGEEKRIVTASPRLDAIASASFGLSRTQIQEWIRQGKVRCNDRVAMKPEIEMKHGDLISCRGLGRIKILEQSGITRKDRLAWRVQVYQDKK